MTASQAFRVQLQLNAFTASMITGEATLIEGKFLNSGGGSGRVMGIVQRIEREDGSGRNYIITTADGYQIFVKLPVD